jgi:hypothetical protein
VGATTPVWVPLLVAILGLLGTAGGAIVGVLITQRRSDRREKAAWDREREREREVWAREDAARTFELRRQSYVEYFEAVDAVIREYNDMMVRLGMLLIDDEDRDVVEARSSGTPEFSKEKQRAYYSALDRVEMYGSTRVLKQKSEISLRVLKARQNLTFATVNELERQRAHLLQAIRVDLGVPSEAIEAPTSNKLAN